MGTPIRTGTSDLSRLQDALIRGHLRAGECEARELASEAASLVLDAPDVASVLPRALDLARRAAAAHEAYAAFVEVMQSHYGHDRSG